MNMNEYRSESVIPLKKKRKKRKSEMVNDWFGFSVCDFCLFDPNIATIRVKIDRMYGLTINLL